MKMIVIKSNAIEAVGYDSQTLEMKIRCKHGSTYDFCGVPAHIFRGLLDAASPGTYYNTHIRDRYPC